MVDGLAKVEALEVDAVALEDLVPRPQPNLPGQPSGLRGLHKDPWLLRGPLDKSKMLFLNGQLHRLHKDPPRCSGGSL